MDAAPSTAQRHKSISRTDHAGKHTHGWLVRVRFAGETATKFFSDRKHGGTDKALQEAIRFRDSAERQLGKPRTERVVVGISPRSSTGVQGVHRVVKTEQTASGAISVRPVYEVTWSPAPNVLKRTSVAITKHGEEEAFRRAVEIRRQKEREHYAAPHREQIQNDEQIQDAGTA